VFSGVSSEVNVCLILKFCSIIFSEIIGNLVAEDKIVFGLNALAVSQLTLAKIRKIYSKLDAKAIAKQVKK